jgi:glycosyltransferase involved in cell wall biosynthesis
MISVIVLTKNEEKNIVDCIDTIPEDWEVIVIDDNSTDRTVDLVKSLKRKVAIYEHDLNGNFSEQRNYGLKKAIYPWVLFLDADERLTNKLVNELIQKTTQTIYSGFKVRRVDHLWGRTLRNGEFKDLWLLRFAMKGKGEWRGVVHETWRVDGRVGKLQNELDHYPHQTIAEFLAEINMYTTLRARELYGKKIQVKGFEILLYPKVKFIQNYFLKMGFRDGTAGFIVAVLMSFHSFLVRGKLWLMYHKK